MTDTPQPVAHVPAERLREFALDTLRALGFPEQSAVDVADAMTWGDLRGLRSHGVVHRLAQCVRRVRAGGTDAAAVPEVVRETESLVVLEGHNAWGQAATIAALRHAVRKAAGGIGLATVRNTSSPAALGYYADRIAREGLVGVALTNCPALIAAPGGVSKVLGNQAHAFGFPALTHPPVVFDSSVTLMSTTEMDRRIAHGESLPEGVLLDREGKPTLDPSDWFEGTLVPMGGHRGFGLALAFEILTSVLAGSDRPSVDVSHPYEFDRPQGVSVTVMVIDPAVLGPVDDFTRRVDRIIDDVHASGAGESRPRVPGERQARVAEERAVTGIPVSADERDQLRELAKLVGVEAPV